MRGRPERRAGGYSLLELIVVMAGALTVGAVAVPWFRAYAIEAHLLGAGRVFKGEFLRARSIAVRTNTNTAIRFERAPDGAWFYSVYVDGNFNGVRAADIAREVDHRIAGPRRLDAGAPGVTVAIHAGVPAPPPEGGRLDTANPIQFGRSGMLSFSPLGTATPGTFYLAGQKRQAAVRVTPGTARVRLMIWSGKRWTERS